MFIQLICLITLLVSHGIANADCPSVIREAFYTLYNQCDSFDKIIEQKVVRNSSPFETAEINYFDPTTQKVSRREILLPLYGAPAAYKFTYSSSSSWDDSVSKIQVFNSSGKFVRNYFVEPKKELEQNQASSQASSPKVIILDSGFEWTHPNLINKHYRNSNEVIDGLDNDNDGWVDNLTTIKGMQSGGGSVEYSFNLNDTLYVGRIGEPVSHGTFVADLAMKNINHIRFLGASGALDSPVFLFKMIELIRKHQIRYSNLSFGLQDKSGGSVASSETFQALKDYISSTPNTLHFVAVVNQGIDFDNSRFSEYPACYRHKNQISVSSLKAHTVEANELSSYQPSDKSSYGVRCVDIYAPGEDLKAAGIYPLEITLSGNTFASATALNVALQMDAINSSLPVEVVKQVILKTAYVPKKPLPVRSGGFIFPKRALKAIQLIDRGLSVDQAIQQSRESVTAKDELNNWSQLQALWQQNRI